MRTLATALAPTKVDDDAVRRLVPVGTLPSALRTALCAGAMVYDLRAGGRMEGGEAEMAESMFLVEGSIDLHTTGQTVLQLRAGEGAACHALYALGGTAAYLLASEDSRLLQVDQALLSALLICVAASDQLADQPWLPRLLASEPFSRLPPSGLYHLAEVLERVEAEAGELLIRQNDVAEHYYLLASGRCAIEWQPDETAEAVTLATALPGDGFGEEALIAGMPRTASVRTQERSTLLRLTREQLDALMQVSTVPRCGLEEARALVDEGAFWLDVRLPEEHANDAPEGSVNMPLGALRQGMQWLDRGNRWIVCCNAGRRSEAAVTVLAAAGFDVRLLDGGLYGASARDEGVRANLGHLQEQRLQAEAELESALRESAAAEAAVAASTREADPEAVAQATALREAATRARATLDVALRHKLQLDTQWRNLEAEIRARHARAQAECVRLRNETEQRLRAERERLSNEAGEAARAMQALREERKRAEARFADEQQALNERMQRERQELEAKARRIREEMERARVATAENLQRIRIEHGAAERRLVKDAETRLANERRRLQAEISHCLQAQSDARAELQQVETLQQEAARAAEQARQRLQSELQESRRRRDTELRAEQTRLAEAALDAERRLAEAERLSEQTRHKREHFERTMDGPADQASEPSTEVEALSVQAELAVYESQAAGAAREVAEARAAREEAERARLEAETKAAQATASEEELRLRLYEELEEALAVEHAQSVATDQHPVSSPGTAGGNARHTKGVSALHDFRHRVTDDDPLPPDLLADVQQLLRNDTSDDPLHARFLEQRSRLTQNAIAAASEEKSRARDALERARQHLSSLRERARDKDGDPGGNS